jgi:hypothetical protein
MERKEYIKLNIAGMAHTTHFHLREEQSALLIVGR